MNAQPQPNKQHIICCTSDLDRMMVVLRFKAEAELAMNRVLKATPETDEFTREADICRATDAMCEYNEALMAVDLHASLESRTGRWTALGYRIHRALLAVGYDSEGNGIYRDWISLLDDADNIVFVAGYDLPNIDGMLHEQEELAAEKMAAMAGGGSKCH